MLVFISRQKFLRLRLQLNLIKVKPALAEGGQRGGGGWDGRWSAWYSYSKSDFIIIFNFWFTAHFERVPLVPPLASTLPHAVLSFFPSLQRMHSWLCPCVRVCGSRCQQGQLRLPALLPPTALCPHSTELSWHGTLGSTAQQQHKSQPHTHTPNDANFYTQQQQQRELEQQPAPNCCHTEIATARKYNCKSFLQKDLQNYNNKNNNKIKHCNMVTRKRQQQWEEKNIIK